MFYFHPSHLVQRLCCFRTLVACALFISLCSCSSNTGITPAFYFWKNNSSNLYYNEWYTLQATKAKVLYVKFFEVREDPLYTAVPTAKSYFSLDDHKELSTLQDSVAGQFEIIPCIFIVNSTLKKIRASYIDTLADNILYLTNKYYRENMSALGATFTELQIDCDWTISTREAYFALLRALKTKSRLKLSCTLRLFPYAYPAKMGVPPVDRVSLMCYNLLNMREEKNRNSILDVNELEKYLAEANEYPLPLDVALPLFSWAQIYQQGRLVDLMEIDADLRASLIHKGGAWYELKEDFETYSMYLRKGEKVKLEEVRHEELQKAIALLRKHVKLAPEARVALFHLDDNTLQQYSNEKISALFSSFSN